MGAAVPRPLRIPAAVAVLMLAMAGCGESSEDPIEVTKQYIEAYDRGDLRVCDELVTEGYLESLGRAVKQDGRVVCEKQVKQLEPGLIVLDVIPSVEERGDIVDVTARLFVNGRQVQQKIRLKREDGELLVDRVDEEQPAQPPTQG